MFKILNNSKFFIINLKKFKNINFLRNIYQFNMSIERNLSSINNNTSSTTSASSNSNQNINNNSSSNSNHHHTTNKETTTNKDLNGDINSKTNTYIEDYHQLKVLCIENSEFFQNDKSEKGQKLCNIFKNWLNHIENSINLIEEIAQFANEYDFDEVTPGNGYRSFIRVTTLCINYGLNVCKNVKLNRKKVFFRKSYYVKEVEACHNLLASLNTCLQYLLIIRNWSNDGELFSNGIHTVEELFERGNEIDQYAFYGRCLGFQYRQSIQGVVRFISICMAGFSEVYYSVGGRIAKTTSSMWTGGKYFLNPELRARRIVNISQNASIDFCKSYWFLAESELMHAIPSIVGSNVKVNNVINIPPEPLKMELMSSSSGATICDDDLVQHEIEINGPSCHIGPSTVVVRLLSSNRRQNMIRSEGSKMKNLLPPADALLFHCHGGGFVAQSSKSHELYLRDWAVALNIPILSIDYSLAPEAPFPRGLEEVFYAYCWAIKNATLLGTTCKKIILAGDSAGANLCLGVILKCIQMGIRKPDGVFLAYCPTLVSFVPSPARMLCLMDPILPFGFMMRCLKAYACPSNQILEENKQKTDVLNDIKNASANNLTYSMCCLNDQNKMNGKSSVTSSLNGEDSKCELVQTSNKDLSIPPTSPFSDDGTSDTFASASQSIENTDLITPEDLSSCISFEDDSQPITQMPIQTNNNDTAAAAAAKVESTEEYVDNFLQKYLDEPLPSQSSEERNCNVLETSIAKTPSEENIIKEASKVIISTETIQSKLYNAVNNFQVTMNKFIGSSKIQTPQCTSADIKKLNALIARSPSDEFVFEVPKDPFLSPYYTLNEHLEQYPPVRVLTVDMDPCLDDCVMFAKKLKALNVDVSLDILEGLPHGFLNFTMLSAEAMDGSKKCIALISDLLNDDGNKETK